MKHSTEPVASLYVKAGDLVRSCQRLGHRLDGIRTPLRTVSMPASARMASNMPGNFPSPSLIRYRARQPVPQGAVDWAVAPRILILRLACSITASTCSRAPDRGDRLQEVAGQQRRGLGTQETSPRGGTALRRRVDSSRPGRAGRDRRACRRASISRCLRSTVFGRTTRRSRLSTSLGSPCSSAPPATPGQRVNRTVSGPSCRCRTRSVGFTRTTVPTSRDEVFGRSKAKRCR
jgi:hypothetical protein